MPKVNIPEFYKKLLLLNGFFLVLVCVVLWRVTTVENRRIEMPIPPEIDIMVSSSTPVTLSIPSLELVADIVPVGITAGGNMAVPERFEDVGWYRHGYEPGIPGNAVLAGHLDTGGGKPAVFQNLQDVKIDDIVFVTNEAGETLEFIVTGMALYDYDNAPLELIFGSSEESQLNLITCDGIWLPEEKTYDQRLIVFTKLVGVAEN
jgi:LPXTG-site transpeptidase (sortase) family protein